MVLHWGLFLILAMIALLPSAGWVALIQWRLRARRRFSLRHRMDALAAGLGLPRKIRRFGNPGVAGLLGSGELDLGVDRFGILRARFSTKLSWPEARSFEASFGQGELVSNAPVVAAGALTPALFRLIAFGGRIVAEPRSVVLEMSLARTENEHMIDAIKAVDTMIERVSDSTRSDEALLAENARAAESAEMRLATLRVAVLRKLPCTAELVRLGLLDPDPAVRFYAAKQAGEGGVEIMRALVSTPEVPSEVREKAIGHVLKYGDFSGNAALLFDAYPKASWWMQIAILQLAKKHAGPTLVEPLRRLAEHTTSAAAKTLAEAFEVMNDPSLEPELIKILDVDNTLGRAAALAALGRIGTPRAVGPIRARLRWLGAQRQLAETALELILARHPADASGWLALSEEEARLDGALSAPDGEGGALTLARASRGAGSLD